MNADRQTMRRYRGLAAGGALCVSGVLVWLGLIWGAFVLVLAALWILARRQGVPVIVYHSVSPGADWLPWAQNISVRPDVFALHMQTLHRAGWRVVPDRAVFEGAPETVQKRCLALHFDDAYFDIAVFALPVLRTHGFAATIFASSDFIDPSDSPRDVAQPSDLRGYLNAPELRAIDAEPLFEVASHGTDHARLPISRRTTAHEPGTWGPETAYLWSLMPGNKARWFETAPPTVRDVPQTDSALTARAVLGDATETESERAARVRAMLATARHSLSDVLGRDVDYLCWPFDRVTPAALSAAKSVGFRRFTGGRADNRAGQPTDVLSRTHIHDRAAGPAPLWVEAIVFRARIEVASGNLLWWPLSVLAGLRRRRTHRPFQRPTP